MLCRHQGEKHNQSRKTLHARLTITNHKVNQVMKGNMAVRNVIKINKNKHEARERAWQIRRRTRKKICSGACFLLSQHTSDHIRQWHTCVAAGRAPLQVGPVSLCGYLFTIQQMFRFYCCWLFVLYIYHIVQRSDWLSLITLSSMLSYSSLTLDNTSHHDCSFSLPRPFSNHCILMTYLYSHSSLYPPCSISFPLALPLRCSILGADVAASRLNWLSISVGGQTHQRAFVNMTVPWRRGPKWLLISSAKPEEQDLTVRLNNSFRETQMPK